MLKKYDDLPDFMKNKEVKKYHDILRKKKFQLILKRVFDIVCSLILLILISPVLLILAIAIKIDSKGPIFYRQKRITTYGREFKIFKFRTMVVDADKKGTLVTLKNDSRITRVGSRIRKCRLDELPQLINVLVGDMSFVGTRPEVKKYVDAYSNEMLATLLMPAGVTSSASLEYRDEDKIIEKYSKKGEEVDSIYINRILPKKMEYNLNYIKSFNILEDIKTCIKTVI